MRCRLPLLLLLVATTPASAADAFDLYTNPVLAKVPTAAGAQEMKELSSSLIGDNDRVIPNSSAALLVVRTNETRWSKLLVQAARQKVGPDKSVPILLIDRFVTYKEGDERRVVAEGKNVYLFPGFRFSLDMGQVVPEAAGGDLQFLADGGKERTLTLGKAQLFLVTKPVPEAAPKKAPKLVVGPVFEMRYFAGSYRLYDDGRRSGKLVLQVTEDGTISGSYYSDKDGAKYEVKGKAGAPAHFVQFTVTFPRSEQFFQGWMFTADGKALAGSAKLEGRETGFYAVRLDDE